MGGRGDIKHMNDDMCVTEESEERFDPATSLHGTMGGRGDREHMNDDMCVTEERQERLDTATSLHGTMAVSVNIENLEFILRTILFNNEKISSINCFFLSLRRKRDLSFTPRM